MSGYVSPYGDTATADATAAPSTYKSPYEQASAPAAKTTYQSPYANGPFADNKAHKPAFDTSSLDKKMDEYGQTVTKPVAGAFELMDRPTKAAYAKHAGRGYWDAMVNGVDPDQAKMDADKAYKDFGDLPASAPLTDPVGKAALDTLVNPLSVLGMPIKGMSTAARIGNAVEGHGFAAAVKGADKAASLLNKVPGGDKITGAVSGVHDFMGVHSAAKRELARLHGAQWLDKYAEYRAQLMSNPDSAKAASDLETEMMKHLDALPAGPQRDSYVKALTRGSQGLPFAESISAPLRGKVVQEAEKPVKPHFTAAQVARMGEQKKPVGGFDALDPGVGGQFDMFAPLKRDQYAADTSKVLSQPSGYRPPTGAYMHDYEPEQLGLLGGRAPTAPEQSLFGPPKIEYGGTGPKPTLGPTNDRLREMAAEIAQAHNAPASEEARILGMMKSSTKGFGAKGNQILNAASVPSDLLTAGMFMQPLGHMANIGGLGLMTDPSAVAGALARGTVDNAKKLVGKGETDASIAARHAGAARGGAISSHTTETTDNALVKGLDAAATHAAKIPVAGQALALVPKAVAGLYRASGDILWKFDDEVKAQRFQHLVDGGMKPERAGLRVGGELVDYENKSPAAKALKPIAPFSTWRTKAPLAVLRNAAENPGKVQALTSLAPAVMGGKQGADPDTGKPYVSSLPGAETNELTSGLPGAGKYALGGLGSIPRLGVDAVGWAEGLGLPDTPRGRAKAKELRTQATYGKEPSEFLLNQLPIMQQIMQFGPAGMFNNGAAPSNLNDLLSLIRVRPGR